MAVALGTPRTSDNCGDDQVVVTNNLAYAPNTDPRFSVGSTTVRWTAIDSAGKSANCSQTIIVNQGRCGRCIWLAWAGAVAYNLGSVNCYSYIHDRHYRQSPLSAVLSLD